MSQKSYFEKLKDPRWQRKRLEVLNAADWKCETCGQSSQELHIHHGYYEFGKEPWDYESETLHVLCDGCHSGATRLMKAIKRKIGKLPVYELLRLHGYISGLQMLNGLNATIPVANDYHAQGIGDAWGLSAECVAALSDAVGGEGVDATVLAETVHIHQGLTA